MKKTYYTYLISAAALFFFYVPAIYPEVSTIDCSEKKINFSSSMAYYIDTGASMTPEQVQASGGFRPFSGPYLNFSYTNAAVWLKFSLRNPCDDVRYLEVGFPNTDYVTLFSFSGREYKVIAETGDMTPYSKRPVEHRRILLPIEKNSRPAEYLLRLKSTTYMTFPVILWEKDAMVGDEYFQLSMIWSFIGLMAILAIYSFIYFAAVRDNEHLFFGLIALFQGISLFLWRGLGSEILYPEAGILSEALPTSAATMVVIVMLLYSRYYLDLPEKAEKLSIMVYISIFLLVSNVAAQIVLKNSFFQHISQPFSYITIAALMFFSLKEYLKGVRAHLYYFMSWIPILITYLIGYLYLWGRIPVVYASETAMPLGGILQIVLLYAGMSAKIGSMVRDLNSLKKIDIRNSHPPRGVTTGTEEKIREALDYINSNFTEDISRENLAASLDLNTDYFCRAFKICTGETPWEYINSLRISLAADMLANTDRPITTIAFETGYESIRTFNRAFKRIKNISPTDFRKKNSSVN
jgi:AraC-like DNA-binding protein